MNAIEPPKTPSSPWLMGLLGERAVVLHGPGDEDGGTRLSGRDLDCAVTKLDPLWPLRLGGGWRFCQCLHYDVRGWFWILDCDGAVVQIDTIDDPSGLGKDGFPTRLLGPTGEPTPAVTAAYLTQKRLRKGDRDAGEWARIGRLARRDPAAFDEALRAVFGERLARLLEPSCLQGRLPDAGTWRRARHRRLARMGRHPGVGATTLALGAARLAERLARPTGLLVLVAGPDGAGKSTLAGNLHESCLGLFRRQASHHWRPGLLPRPGSLLRGGPPDPTNPHADQPHGRAASLALLGYYWLDFLIGGWLWTWPVRARTGLVVVERGWWDIGVDPRRYRLDVPAAFVRALGMFLPHPDLSLVLESSGEVILARKAELTRAEIIRQTAAWRRPLPGRGRHVVLEASRPPRELANEAREAIVDLLEKRAVARLGAGWSELPSRRTSRWLLPRGPRATTLAALSVYHPVTPRARLGWETLRLLAALGGCRLLPRGSPPPRPVREALGPHLPARTTLAVTRSAHPGRYLALLIDTEGRCRGLAKVATNDAAAKPLDREAASIKRFGGLLAPPLAAPRILVHEPGLLLLEAVAWRTRRRPWELDEEVAAALGEFFQAGAGCPTGSDPRGPGHGDFTPWNLLRTAEGWTLIDWEAATASELPFFDLFHYVVQGHALLGRPSAADVLDGVRRGRGWVGRALHAYASGVRLPATAAPRLLREYLLSSPSRLLPRTGAEHDGRAARRWLLEELAR